MNRSWLFALWLGSVCAAFAVAEAVPDGVSLGLAQASASNPSASSCRCTAVSIAESADASSDLPDESDRPVRKASVRKASRRIAKPRSVMRSAPAATVVFENSPAVSADRIPAAVAVVNSTDLSRLCRRQAALKRPRFAARVEAGRHAAACPSRMRPQCSPSAPAGFRTHVRAGRERRPSGWCF